MNILEINEENNVLHKRIEELEEAYKEQYSKLFFLSADKVQASDKIAELEDELTAARNTIKHRDLELERITELEEENNLKALLIKNIGEDKNKIGAQAIRDAKRYAMEEKPSVECEHQNYCNFVELLDEYANELEGE